MASDFKATFFDSSKVLSMMDKKSARAMGKAGAFIRRRAKSSLRYSKKASAPGQPPKVHRGAFTKRSVNAKTGVVKTQAASPLRELIFFGFNTQTKSVVVGPIIFKKSNLVPRTMEHGGGVMVIKREPAKESRRARTEKQREAFRRKIVNGTITRAKKPKPERVGIMIAPRPYMAPAMKHEMHKFVDAFRG